MCVCVCVCVLCIEDHAVLITAPVKGHAVSNVISPNNKLALFFGYPIQVTQHRVLIASIRRMDATTPASSALESSPFPGIHHQGSFPPDCGDSWRSNRQHRIDWNGYIYILICLYI